ncbi:hypothetical protein AX14_000860 [Amanita brunnescens Koide BX004]|nr:hypothetical protein AX14_000860 [Amanita brunnescens Koide BX004]
MKTTLLLAKWITFSWVYPILKKGRSTTLQQDDIWNLSPVVQSRPIFICFSEIRRSTLLRKLWAAKSMDISFDFTVISVLFNYMNPFSSTLDTVDTPNPSREIRSKAYIYAFLAFACSAAKTHDLQHLYFGRRAATRMRSELMASIYEKALKRNDYLGIVDKQEEQEEQVNKAWDSLSKKEKKAKRRRWKRPMMQRPLLILGI